MRKVWFGTPLYTVLTDFGSRGHPTSAQNRPKIDLETVAQAMKSGLGALTLKNGFGDHRRIVSAAMKIVLKKSDGVSVGVAKNRT